MNDDFPISFRFVRGITYITVTDSEQYDVPRLLRASLQRLIERERHQIILDLSRAALDLWSDSALGVFLASVEEVREMGGDIKLVVEDPEFYNTLDLIGLTMLFDVIDSGEDDNHRGDVFGEAEGPPPGVLKPPDLPGRYAATLEGQGGRLNRDVLSRSAECTV